MNRRFEQSLGQFRFPAELYARDVPTATLLPEYPCSNTSETIFENRERFIIHDPFPPPRQSLVKVLGPHHLMCAWGSDIPVISRVGPLEALMDHWCRRLGEESFPRWSPIDDRGELITLFPHESIEFNRQLIDPVVNYELHSKKVIEDIDCPQAKTLPTIQLPCIAKLTHGYAGLGNYLLRSEADVNAMEAELAQHWPNAEMVYNSVIEEIVGDFGVQFYVHRNGEVIWLGLTEQKFNENNRWCGGVFDASIQDRLADEFYPFVEVTAKLLHSRGYFGVCGIDILVDANGRKFLVDVNPRLTGITPFLIASRHFLADGLQHGIYSASCKFKGTLESLVKSVEQVTECRVLILSAFEEADKATTLCHLSASGNNLETCVQTIHRLTV